MRTRVALSLLAAALLCGCAQPKEETLSHGRFDQVIVVRPGGETKTVALFLTDRDGWTPAADRIARALAREGALVIGVSLPRFYAELEKEISGCEYTDGDLENLSHFVQAYYKLPGYTAPTLIGTGEGAAFAFANLAQAPAATFGGAVTQRFQPHLSLRQELCKGEKLVVHQAGDGFDLAAMPGRFADWITVAGDADAAMLARSYATLAATHHIATIAPPSPLADLPIVEVPAQTPKAGAPFAVFWSGDGGWAGLDEEVAAALSQRGVPVVGVDSLRYFWSARKPEGVAADLERIIRYYSGQWRSERVLLIGYSQGADILPATLNRLSAATRSHIALAAAMGLGDHAVFEFHLANWVSRVKEGYETLPEVQKIQGTTFLCIYGSEEDDTICPKLQGPAVRVVELPGSHHFNGDYGRLAEEILKAAGIT